MINPSTVVQLAQALQPWAPMVMGALGFGTVHISVIGVARVVRRELAPIKAELVNLRARVTVLERKPEVKPAAIVPLKEAVPCPTK